MPPILHKVFGKVSSLYFIQLICTDSALLTFSIFCNHELYLFKLVERCLLGAVSSFAEMLVVPAERRMNLAYVKSVRAFLALPWAWLVLCLPM